MRARNQYSSINFLGGFIEGISMVIFWGRFLHCWFWLRGNNFWNFPRCAKCKSPLHGPRNYVDRTWELSANYSARTFPYYRAKPKNPLAIAAWKSESMTGDEKLRKMFSMEFYRVYRPPKVLLRPMCQIKRALMASLALFSTVFKT